jgi:hypothetical protein
MPDPVTQQKDGPEKIVMTAPGSATAIGSPSAEGDHGLTHEISDPR